MVVLEGGGMLSTAANQYLQPDYLSPLPTTLDAKKSPLALLAQTCSQIGADTPPSKPLVSPMEKNKKQSSDTTRTSPKEKTSQRSSPNEPKLAFKPYETNVVTKKQDETRPSSKSSVTEERKHDQQSPERKSTSPGSEKNSNTDEKPSPVPSTRGASPIIRSGLEILQGHPKDTPLGTYKPPGHLSALCCPPGLEHTNPAFRPPFPGVPFAHHHAMLGSYGTAPGPYLSYARVKTPSGSEALVPVCKDPYCTGCQFSVQQNQQLMTACPSGCTQCDHQKYNLAMAMSLVPPNPLPPPPSSLAAYTQLGRPYVCNWIAGEAYCGKRFLTSEELLQHLRTHTSGGEASAVATSTASLFNHSLLRSTYPNPPLSPLSAARYHPYGKPTLGGSLAASPFSAFNAPLGAYYSPYSVYGQRLGAAAAAAAAHP